MKQRRKNILLGAGLVLVMLLSIVAYSRYTQRQIHHESTQNLLSTYGQVSKTFTMFVQRNWNILEIWSDDLAQLAEETNTKVKWRRYVNEKPTGSTARWPCSTRMISSGRSAADGEMPRICSLRWKKYTLWTALS